MALLHRTIETEIIPRLMLSHKTQPSYTQNIRREYAETEEHIAHLTKLVLTQDVTAAFNYVDSKKRSGAGLDALLLNLLAPSARRLGEMWESDVCDFTDVTIGLSRLQQVLRKLCPRSDNELEPLNHGKRAMLTSAPGEQHSFGIYMVEEFFRRAAWDVWCVPPASADDLVKIVSTEWFAVIGFSANSDALLDSLRQCIGAVRKASCNPLIAIMVGGSLFSNKPDLAAFIGADAMAADGKQAVIQAESLFEATQLRC
ncbi:MAG: cobalamin B12-binding domain-containing protein [Hyphomicrobiales bacterium]|nr:cobalamin B12-binding domain-containing protein [Hyphomicrobiales bacterium]